MDGLSGVLSDLSKLLIATAASGAIGFEREAHGQAAGFRTYIVVGVGSCLMMLLSLHVEEIYRAFGAAESVVRVDPGRIASYAIAGMGFLGAGAIIKGKGSVRGLTTAAGLWVVTGIGLSIGAGHIVPALITTIVVLAALYLGHPAPVLSRRRVFVILTVYLRGSATSLDDIRRILSDYRSFEMQFVNYRNDVTSNLVRYRIRLYSAERGEQHWTDIVRRVAELPGVEEVRWGESDVP